MRTSAEMERIRNNILKIMTGFHWITPIYNTTDQWNWRKANNWEKILSEIYGMMLGFENYQVYSGVSASGQRRLYQNRFRHFATPVTYSEPLTTEAGDILLTESGEELEVDIL